MRIKCVGLEHHGDAALGGGHVIEALAINDQIAPGNRLQTGDHAQQGGLAAAGGADKHGELTRLDGQVDAMDDLDIPIGLDDFLQDNTGRHGASP